jgi:hypothetical protein
MLARATVIAVDFSVARQAAAVDAAGRAVVARVAEAGLAVAAQAMSAAVGGAHSHTRTLFVAVPIQFADALPVVTFCEKKNDEMEE